MAKTVMELSFTRAIASEVRPATTAAEEKPKKPRKRREAGDLQEQLRRLGRYPRIAGPYDPQLDDIEALAKRQLDWHLQRARIIETWRKRSRLTDAEEVQARNNPTEDISVDLPEGRKRVRRNETRVRQSEAWRYKQLSPMQRQAESEMGLAWHALTAGLGPAVSRYGAIGGGSGDRQSLSADLEATWLEFMKEAHRRRINVAVVLDCMTEPKTLPEIEKARKMKPGKALATYQTALDVWSELRGWTKRIIEAVHPVEANTLTDEV
ncbi:hypothetical protein [Nitrobacter sp.]|uniref:hypothetical protein n=1 Tax=Nitrobacter sp. TaxID=29420 RepID=UPI0029CABF8B|nr:hypothetical protein [Nitrobacter sp.]